MFFPDYEELAFVEYPALCASLSLFLLPFRLRMFWSIALFLAVVVLTYSVVKITICDDIFFLAIVFVIFALMHSS